MDGLLAYMYTMIAECRTQDIRLDREFLVRCGHGLELFPGVAVGSAASTPSAAARGAGGALCHLLRPAGSHRGQRHRPGVPEIYACEFFYDRDGLASWPKLDVNFTNKTQFVYRINKGVLDVSDDRSLNDSMPDDSKRVPFTNMIYIGDGLSDVPCMKMMRAYGDGAASPCISRRTRQGWRTCWPRGGWTLIFPCRLSGGEHHPQDDHYRRAGRECAPVPPDPGQERPAISRPVSSE